MAFFEDIGKKVSQTSQDALKKTKIMAETTKIHSQISGEKKAIADNYSKIGEKYFELFSESPDENLAQFIAAVKDANQRIEEYEVQINRLRGVAPCPTCGAELPEGALFCTACGTKLEAPHEEKEPAQAAARFCNSCGSPMADGVKFCSNCGSKTE